MPSDQVLDPEEVVISAEEIGRMEEQITEILSDLEWQVLNCYLDGKSYVEIADELQRHVKSVDNALQRVKRKLERYMDSKSITIITENGHVCLREN